MKEAFREKKFSRLGRGIIDSANYVIKQHQAEGYKLTIRQLYYRCVAGNYIENSLAEYKRLSLLVNEARLAGLIDWDGIEDRTKPVQTAMTYADLASFIQKQPELYTEDVWLAQPHYCEVWIEKDSLVGTVEAACNTFRVPYFACRGYASQSSLHEAGKRLRNRLDRGQAVTVFHLGDHDPSGLDMSRDNEERLNMFTRTQAGVNLVRLGVTYEQVVALKLPCDPIAVNESAYKAYASIYGPLAWEIDALPPSEIHRLVLSAIDGIVDRSLLHTSLTAEYKVKDELYEAGKQRLENR